MELPKLPNPKPFRLAGQSLLVVVAVGFQQVVDLVAVHYVVDLVAVEVAGFAIPPQSCAPTG